MIEARCFREQRARQQRGHKKTAKKRRGIENPNSSFGRKLRCYPAAPPCSYEQNCNGGRGQCYGEGHVWNLRFKRATIQRKRRSEKQNQSGNQEKRDREQE